MTSGDATGPVSSPFDDSPRTLDLRATIVRAAEALHDAGTVGAPQTYLAVERELRTLIAVMDEVASRAE